MRPPAVDARPTPTGNTIFIPAALKRSSNTGSRDRRDIGELSMSRVGPSIAAAVALAALTPAAFADVGGPPATSADPLPLPATLPLLPSGLLSMRAFRRHTRND